MTWFVLIALSPVLTYQHHLIDIVGGFVLAGYCFYLFRERTLAPPLLRIAASVRITQRSAIL
jgi:membrane-associated phospholipid phosphatase